MSNTKSKEYKKNQTKKILKFVNDKKYKPLKRDEMIYFLSVPKDEKHLFHEIINDLEVAGKIFISKKGKILPVDSKIYIIGTLFITQKGFGFVRQESENLQTNATESVTHDIFIPEDSVKEARHKDKVVCKIIEPATNGRRPEGVIVKIMERGFKEIVGVYEDNRTHGYVYPDEKRIADKIYIPHKFSKGAVSGHKVCVEITKIDEHFKTYDGKIISIIGHMNDPGVDVLSILKQLGIRTEFDPMVISEAESLPSFVTQDDINGRVDLREKLLITIDGDDSKDIDDAVSIEMIDDNNFRLGVHIADVTHYVKEGMNLDTEALERGTSVYVPGRVTPMLPHKLSNGICSLNSNVDRLALSCTMDIDKNGNVISHEIFESVVNVKERMTYNIVEDLLTNSNSPFSEKYNDIMPMLKIMAETAKILFDKRIKRGAIEFKFAECKILVDNDGKVTDVQCVNRNTATNIIEEFMLVCNETIARHFFEIGIPFVYRTHDLPDSAKIENLVRIVKKLGFKIKAENINFQELLSKFEGLPEEALVNRLALRSMKQARYSSENDRHFGLNADYYCHFTSPIRRYPDLQIHRIIKEHIRGIKEPRIAHYENILSDVCRRCSATERTAEEAEREVEDLKKVEFMEDKTGCEYEGVVSGVTTWGMYVELANTIEGVVSIETMNEHFHEDVFFDEENIRFVVNSSKKSYRLGDNVKVFLINADVAKRRINFGLV